MRASLQRRLSIAVGVSLGAGLLVSGYVLQRFRVYEDAASRVMSGDQRTVIQGRLVEAKVNAAAEAAQASTNSEESNQAFRERLVAISEDIKALGLDDARRQISELIAAKSEATEDLFVHYRNIKTTAFNIYREAWANKWMTVAHNLGLVINDLDNIPYNTGDRAAAGVIAKIGPLVALITRSPLPQASKMALFSQLSGLKAQVLQYGEAAKRAEATRATRVEELKGLATTLKRHNEKQGKGMLEFGNTARNELFKAMIVVLLFVLFAMGWWFAAGSSFRQHVAAVAKHVREQFDAWISASGSVAAPGFEAPTNPDSELVEAFRAMDQAMRRMNAVRKEDILVKRLLSVPYALVNRNRQAIFWNSALSILGKVRALEETGPVSYSSLFRFASIQGKAVDPIDRALAEGQEIVQLALLRVGSDGIAVQATCTPVLGPDHQPEYVMVHIRDLRDENKRTEAELERQLECVRTSIESVRAGLLPPEPGPAMRTAVIQAIKLLKEHALDLQEKSGLIAGQVGTLRDRISRETGLKKNVHGRMEQVHGEISTLRSQIEELRVAAEVTIQRSPQIAARGKLLRSEYEDVRRRAAELARDLKANHALIGSCLENLAATEAVSVRVRSNERMIRGLLEKSAVLNANNSILGSKGELTPADVVTITENITQLLNQFERGYRFIEQSVSDVERGVAELSMKLKKGLDACAKLSDEDHGIARSITESEKVVNASTQEAAEFARELSRLKAAAGVVGEKIQGVEGRMRGLVQIGLASLELQTQLELGFDGVLGTVAPAAADSAAGVGAGGVA